MSNIANIQQEFGEYLFNFIKSKVSTVEDAQDIYQEVIFKVINKSSQLTKSESLKSWLFTIAKNQIIDYYRIRKKPIEIENLPFNSMSQQEEQNAYEELESCLTGFIDQLPNDYKEIITLSEIEGKSQKELSESMNMNYITLRSKVQRGRNKIKKMISEACLIEQDSSGRVVDCSPRADSSCDNNLEKNCS